MQRHLRTRPPTVSLPPFLSSPFLSSLPLPLVKNQNSQISKRGGRINEPNINGARMDQKAGFQNTRLFYQLYILFSFIFTYFSVFVYLGGRGFPFLSLVPQIQRILLLLLPFVPFNTHILEEYICNINIYTCIYHGLFLLQGPNGTKARRLN